MKDLALLDHARVLAPSFRAHRRAIERDRRLGSEIVESLVGLGALRSLAPASIGAPELSPLELIELIETLSQGDAAAGWVTMVASTTSLAGGYLSEEGAREIFGRPETIACGVFAPGGRATEVEGGFRVSGRWSFGSGSGHAHFLLGGFLVAGETPRLATAFFRRVQVEILDTWDTVGMGGTGSHDFVVEDVFVPAHRTLALTGKPREKGRTYRFPLFGLLALGVSAVATGIARAALDDFRELALHKRPQGAKRTLAEREIVQADLARAETELRAARALVREAVREVELRFALEESMRVIDRAELRAAATHATHAAAHAVDLVYRAAGSTSIHEGSPFAQYFRDVHVATQHAMVGEPVFTLAGRVMLGLPTDETML